MSSTSSTSLPETALALIAVISDSSKETDLSLLSVSPLRGVRTAGLIGLIEPVEQDLLRRIQEGGDQQWLAHRLASHHEHVMALHEHCDVFPMQFATVLADADAVLNAMNAHSAAIHAFLEQVHSREEWSLKVRVRSVSAAPVASNAGGAAYLRELKRASDERDAFERQRLDAAQALVQPLLDRASDHRFLVPSRPIDEETVLLNVAVLVSRAEREWWTSLAQSSTHTEQGLELTLTGPWPAYSFRPRIGD